MKTHPLNCLKLSYATIFRMSKQEYKKFIEKGKAEDEKRWKDFISEKVLFT